MFVCTRLTCSLVGSLVGSLVVPLVVSLAATCGGCATTVAPEKNRPPNFVVIFVDDLGYGDIGPFGSKKNRTPNLDGMANDGMRLTSFYAAPVCTPSRASLMTGCYPNRVGLHQGSWHGVLMPEVGTRILTPAVREALAVIDSYTASASHARIPIAEVSLGTAARPTLWLQPGLQVPCPLGTAPEQWSRLDAVLEDLRARGTGLHRIASIDLRFAHIVPVRLRTVVAG